MKSLTEQVHEYICKNDTQFSSEELANMVRYFTQEQEKEIEVLKQSYEILFKHRIEQEKKIVDLEEQLRPLKSVNWDINNPSLRFINNA